MAQLDDLEEKAKQGDVRSQFKLGVMYFRGQGAVEQDYGKAREWFEKAANNGHTVAKFNLGTIYGKGLGLEKNPKKAKEWYDKYEAAAR